MKDIRTQTFLTRLTLPDVAGQFFLKKKVVDLLNLLV